MTLSPVIVEQPGGLVLGRDPDEIAWAGAIDVLNTEHGANDRVTNRKGFARFTGPNETDRFWRLMPFYETNGTRQLIAAAEDSFHALTPSGNTVERVSQNGVAYFAAFGDPTREAVYFGSTGDVIGRYVAAASNTGSSVLGTTLATVDGTSGLAMPKGGAMTVSPSDNRLVVAAPSNGPNGAASNPSRVWFSDEGNPESWQSNNFVDLTPGDGEQITALVAWQNYVIAFKQTKFFVFFDTSPDATGNPVFNYRPVDVGIGISLSRGNGWPAIATDRGVYFVDGTGIYLTTGGSPAKVTADMDPFFRGGTLNLYTGGIFNQGSNANASLAFHDDRLYLACRSGATNDRVLVFDTRWGWWSVWDLPANTLVPFRTSQDGREELYFSRSDAGGVAKMQGTTDDGNAITVRYRSGFSDLGSPLREKTILETQLVGSGTVNFAWSRDFQAPSPSRPVAFGTGIGRATHREAAIGDLLSYSLTGNVFTVFRAVPVVRELRSVGLSS